MKGKITSLFLIIACISAVEVSAMWQSQLAPNIDSLRALLSKSQGEEQVKILLQLSDQTRRSSIDSAIGYARKALEEAKLLENGTFRAESHRKLGGLLSRNGENPEGLQHLLTAERLYVDLEDPDKEATTLENLGALYRRQSDYSKALEYYYSALNIKERLNNRVDLANTLKNIGVVNEQLGQMQKAIDFYERALKVSEQNNNASEIAINSVQLGNAYASTGETEQALQSMNRALEASKELPGEHATASILLEISELYKNKKSFQEAMTANKEALRLAKEISVGSLQALAMRNIGMIYVEQNDPVNANKYLLQALPLFEKSGMQEGAIRIQNQLARNYLDRGRSSESIDMGLLALESAKKVKNYVLSRQTLEVLIKAYRSTGEYGKALSAQEELLAVKDSIFDRAKSRQIAEMQIRYNTKKKEQEIVLLQKEKEQQALLWNAFLVGLVLIGIIGVLVYNRQRLKIQKNETELENTRLKEQKLEQELEFKNKQLTTHTLHLVQKNEAMQELKDKIGDLRQNGNGDINKGLQKLQNLVDYSFNLDKDWEQFQIYFEEIHDGFFDALKARYPDLTPNELRLSALAKLNLSIKETATILGITPDSVKTARYRLRKKLRMETEENLTEFMMEIEREGVG